MPQPSPITVFLIPTLLISIYSISRWTKRRIIEAILILYTSPTRVFIISYFIKSFPIWTSQGNYPSRDEAFPFYLPPLPIIQSFALFKHYFNHFPSILRTLCLLLGLLSYYKYSVVTLTFDMRLKKFFLRLVFVFKFSTQLFFLLFFKGIPLFIHCNYTNFTYTSPPLYHFYLNITYTTSSLFIHHCHYIFLYFNLYSYYIIFVHNVHHQNHYIIFIFIHHYHHISFIHTPLPPHYLYL